MFSLSATHDAGIAALAWQSKVRWEQIPRKNHCPALRRRSCNACALASKRGPEGLSLRGAEVSACGAECEMLGKVCGEGT